MGLIEKYSRSINSSNLRSDEYHHDTDNLAAVALSSEYGGLLFRAKFATAKEKPDKDVIARLLEKWTATVESKRQWPKHISAKKVAEISLGYWLDDTCAACTGRGYPVILNTPSLDANECHACSGSGRAPLVCDARIKDAILDMVELLDRTATAAGSVAMRKLAGDMEF